VTEKTKVKTNKLHKKTRKK